MTEEELFKLSKQELEWLRYYSHVDSRNAFSKDSEIYRDLQSIGYAKRTTTLDLRCSPCIITSNTQISSSSLLKDLFIVGSTRNNLENRYTPLEIVWILFPGKKEWVINGLK